MTQLDLNHRDTEDTEKCSWTEFVYPISFTSEVSADFAPSLDFSLCLSAVALAKVDISVPLWFNCGF